MPYYVYVIELDLSVTESKKFMRRNKKMKKGKKCFYVGQSAKKPKERFNQHLTGYKSNYFAREYGMKLRKWWVWRINPLKTRKEAEKEEKKLAKKLKNKGYGVWWG